MFSEVEPHPVCSSSMQSKKIMGSSEDVFSCIDLWHGGMFKVMTKFRSLVEQLASL